MSAQLALDLPSEPDDSFAGLDVAPSAWTVDDTVRLLAVGRPGYELTAEQRAAVAAPLRPGLLIAGAGSGKTEVMAARVLHLVASGQVRPDQVLGLTFTVKATASLADRIRSVLDRLRQARGGTADPLGLGHGTAATRDGTSAAELLDGEPTVSTYNGFGARLVADHGLRIGIEPGVRLAAEGLRWQLALRVVRSWAGALDVELTPTTVADRVRQLSDELANHLATPTQVRASDAGLRRWVAAAEAAGVRVVAKATEALRTCDVRDQLLALAEAYERTKRDLLLIDHGDQIALAAELAALPAVAAAERRQYAVVLLDEYQDTNVAQRILLQRLFGGGHPVTAVGDPAQSIYAFRGASVSNIVRFPEQFPNRRGEAADVYPLSTNFRSGGAILQTANRISAGLAHVGEVGPPVLVPRAGRELGGPDAGEVRAALLRDVEAEADWVADRLVEASDARRAQHAEHCAVPDCQGWHEVAVLCRKRSQFGLLRDALEQRNVPVEVVGLGGLLDAPEVADVVAVLRVLHDPTSNDAMIRLLTGPRWRIGPRDLEALGRRARLLVAGSGGRRSGRGPGVTNAPADGTVADGTAAELALALVTDEVEVGALADALEQLDGEGDAKTPDLDAVAPLSPEAGRRLRDLRADLAGLRRRLGQPLPDLVADVERTLGLDVELEATPQAVGRGRRANMLAFSEVAANFVGIDGETHLGAFLASLEAAEDAEDGYDLGTPSPADTAKILTVHAAKGLEWDVVAVPGLAGGRYGVFPSKKGSPQWPWRADRLPRDVRGDREDLPAWTEPTTKGVQAFGDACKARDQQEERRLAYVAVTRARSALFCSGFWWGATAATAHRPASPFYEEVEAACLAGAGSVEPRAPEPEEGEVNPLLDGDRIRDVPWPPQPAVPDGVAQAAEAVRRRVAESVPAAKASTALTAELSAADRARLELWERDAEVLLRERVAATAARLVVLPDDLSVSEVVDLERDPQGLAMRLARPLPRRPAPAARRGTAFHAWLEQRAVGRSLLGPDDLPGAGDDPADEAATRIPGPGPTAWSAEGGEPDDLARSAATGSTGTGAPVDEFEVLRTAFLASSWADRQPVAVEVPFELVLGGHLVRGRIDAVFQDADGRYDVVDYKTGRRPSGAEAAAAALQLACYRLAWSELAGVASDDVRAAFLYVRDGDGGLVRPPLLDRSGLEQVLEGIPEAPTDSP